MRVCMYFLTVIFNWIQSYIFVIFFEWKNTSTLDESVSKRISEKARENETNFMLTFINLIKLFIGQCKCTRIYNGYNINWINQMNIANCNVTKATYKMNIQIHYTQYTCIVYRIEPRWNWRKYTTIAKRVMWNEWKEMTFEEIVTIFVFHSYIPRKRIWFHSFFFLFFFFYFGFHSSFRSSNLLFFVRMKLRYSFLSLCCWAHDFSYVQIDQCI